MVKKKKKIKRGINQLDERSNEVKEVLGKSPSWLIRWGITVILSIILLLIIGSSVISYNDVLPSKIVITTENPPAYLAAKSTGILTNVFVEANQHVEEGEILAEIENTANFDDVYLLKKRIENLIPSITSLDSLREIFPPFLNLGPIQFAYGDFLIEYQNNILYNSLEPNKREYKVISGQIRKQQSLLKDQQNQLFLFEEELELSKNRFDRNKQLYQKNVISKSEYEEAQRVFLTDRSRYENLKSAISNTMIAIAEHSNSLIRTNIEGEEVTNYNRQSLEQAYQILYNEILNWEKSYILKSPMDGKVTIFDVWNKNQNINAGEILFTIVPDDYAKIIGKLSVPVQNSGKVDLGQRVIIKLDNYPNLEWGNLNGKIINISDVPKRGGEQALYTIYVDIDSLVTSYNKEIEFKQEMQGTAEIVLEELTVLERIFYQIRNVFAQ